MAANAVPVLPIYDRDDTVVPYEQSSLMAEARTRAHKNVQRVGLKQEDHWPLLSATRLQALQALAAFLQTNNLSPKIRLQGCAAH